MKTASPRFQSAPVVPRTPQPPGPFFWGAFCVGRRFSLKVAQIARVGRSMHPMGHLGRCGRRGAATGHQKGPPTTTGASRASAELGHENPPPPPPNGQGVLPRDHWACWTGWVAAQQRKMTRPGARLATRGFFSCRQKSLPEARVDALQIPITANSATERIGRRREVHQLDEQTTSRGENGSAESTERGASAGAARCPRRAGEERRQAHSYALTGSSYIP